MFKTMVWLEKAERRFVQPMEHRHSLAEPSSEQISVPCSQNMIHHWYKHLVSMAWMDNLAKGVVFIMEKMSLDNRLDVPLAL